MGLSTARSPRVVGRYALYSEIAAGGMAAVYFGRLLGPAGFQRTVAVKQLHPQFSRDADFVAQFLDEARITARISHGNVVQTLDIIADDQQLLIVMEYVHGETLARMLRSAQEQHYRLPVGVALAIAHGMLHGLHAAHETRDDRGQRLGIVHRDVSPQNVMVGCDGVVRVLDFGIAKAASRAQVTRQGHIKGKLSYMAPEQARARGVDRRADVYAAGIVLWETLTGQRLFWAENQVGILNQVLHMPVPPPSSRRRDVPPEIDAIVLKALDRDPERRFMAASDFALALEAAGELANPREVGSEVERLCGADLAARAAVANEISRQGAHAEPTGAGSLASDLARRSREKSPTAERPVPITDSTSQVTRGGWLGSLTPAALSRRTGLLMVAALLSLATAGALYTSRFVARDPGPYTSAAPPNASAATPATAATAASATAASAVESSKPEVPVATPAPSIDIIDVSSLPLLSSDADAGVSADAGSGEPPRRRSSGARSER